MRALGSEYLRSCLFLMTRFLHFPCYNNLSDILMSNRFAFNIIYWTLSTMTTLIWVSDPPSVCVYINILVLFSVSRIQILSSNSNKALLKFQRFYFMAENAISRRVQSFYGKFTEWRSRERRWEVIQFFQFRWWLDFDINNKLFFRQVFWSLRKSSEHFHQGRQIRILCKCCMSLTHFLGSSKLIFGFFHLFIFSAELTFT